MRNIHQTIRLSQLELCLCPCPCPRSEKQKRKESRNEKAKTEQNQEIKRTGKTVIEPRKEQLGRLARRPFPSLSVAEMNQSSAGAPSRVEHDDLSVWHLPRNLIRDRCDWHFFDPVLDPLH
jgi:hypothetical protein